MNRVKELKRTLGSEYVYHRFMSDREVSCLRRQAPQHLEDTVAASLTVGCMKINAVLFQSDGSLRLGYDVYVKDSPGSSEWICFTLEFGYQSTQYVNINVYVRSANSQDGSGKIAKGSIAKGVLLSGVSDVACFAATENTEEPYEVEKFEDPSFKGVSEDGIYKMTQNSQGEPIEPVDSQCARTQTQIEYCIG